MKKQTAVQILSQFLEEHCNPSLCDIEYSDFKQAIREALAMEKQDKEKCFVEGLDYGIKRMKGKTTESITGAFETYYKQTYED
jgi:hypothetical protein